MKTLIRKRFQTLYLGPLERFVEFRINIQQRRLGLLHQPGPQLLTLTKQAERVCSQVKSDAVLGEYFTSNNPWSNRRWREFNYWNGWYALASLTRPSRILEIGTAFGFAAIALASGAGQNLKLLVSLDLGNFGRLFIRKGCPEMDNLEYVRVGIDLYREGSGVNFEYLQFRVNTQPPPYTDNEGNPVECLRWQEDAALIQLLKRTKFDLILIDGKHTDDGLYNDLTSFFDSADSGCLIMCDDLQHRDCIRSFQRFIREHWLEIAESCVWRYLRADTTYGGTFRRDQGLLLKR